MRFFLRKRRQPPAVIIVALIDVLIVVLIFLMVTTTFKKAPPASLKVALPDSNHTTKPGASEAPLLLAIEANGSLRLGPEATPVTLERLKSELAAALAKNPKVKLALNADKKAPFGQCFKVMEAAQDAHIQMQVNANPLGKPAGRP